MVFFCVTGDLTSNTVAFFAKSACIVNYHEKRPTNKGKLGVLPSDRQYLALQ